MSENPEHNSHATTWTVTLLLLPVLYVLSVGPVEYLNTKLKLDLEDNQALLAFYYPTSWLFENTPLKKPMMNYVRWWLRMAGTPELELPVTGF